VRRGAWRAVPVKCRLAGLEALNIDDTACSSTSRTHQPSPLGEIPQADRGGDYGTALEVARQQVTSGAQIIDVTWTRACWTRRPPWVALPEPGGGGAGHRPRAVMIDPRNGR